MWVYQILALLIITTSCTKLPFDEVNERVDDSINGSFANTVDIDPDGNEVLQGPYNRESILYAHIDLNARPTRGCGWANYS